MTAHRAVPGRLAMLSCLTLLMVSAPQMRLDALQTTPPATQLEVMPDPTGDGTGETVVGLIRSLQTLPPPPKMVRWRAVKMLGKLRRDAALGVLVNLTQDTDRDIRRAAVWALGEIGNPRATEALLRALADCHESVAEAARIALVKIGKPSPVLESVLQETNPMARARAVSLLGLLDPSGNLRLITAALRDQDARVRETAVRTLGRLGTTLLPRLIKTLESFNRKTQQQALNRLAELPTALQQPLLHALQDGQPRVSAWAAWALGEIGARIATPPKLRFAGQALATRTREIFAQMRLRPVPALTVALTHQRPEVRWQAARALGKVRVASAVGALLKVLHDTHREVRWHAAVALGNLQDATAIPGLLATLQDHDALVREHAVSALGALQAEAAVPQIGRLLQEHSAAI